MDRDYAEVWYSWTGTAPKSGIHGPGMGQSLVFMDGTATKSGIYRRDCTEVWYSWTGSAPESGIHGRDCAKVWYS